MENMILTKEKWRPSFYEDFRDEQIGVSELFNTVGELKKRIIPQ
jgi:hypothetical protein